MDIKYPQLFDKPYLRDEVRLEIGPLAEGIPSHKVSVIPFAAEEYKSFFSSPVAWVKTIDVERTFWEKTTILHKVANRDIEKVFPPRYARHYYDLYCLIKSGVKESAFQKKELLEQDVTFKKKFYYSGKSGYETAQTKTIQLLPKSEDVEALKNDYKHMLNMIYGDIPDFTVLLKSLKELEDEIHQLGYWKLISVCQCVSSYTQVFYDLNNASVMTRKKLHKSLNYYEAITIGWFI